jgi:predicted restriction endonuclease
LSEAIESDDAGPVTVTDRLQKVRVGQQRFREGLLDLWGAQCALTGIRDQRLLIASHIKPWRLSNDYERVDPHNGILLEARFDKLFDAGLISFDQQGHMMVSSLIDSSDRVSLGLSDTMALRKNLAPLIPYLTFHRQHVFLS